MGIRRFEEIEGWQIARKLTVDVYEVTRTDPFCRDFGLRDQIRRAAGSLMHNIAEGFDSGSSADFIRFLRYARRSCSEVQSQLYVALDQEYITKDTFASIYQRATLARSKVGAFARYLEDYGKRNNSRGSGAVRETEADYVMEYGAEFTTANSEQ
jgi:four helix bundle protein